jgi:hypothetical protein
MKQRLTVLALVSFSASALAACGRHVVLDPLEAVRSNDATWNVQREPAPDGGSAPPPGPR